MTVCGREILGRKFGKSVSFHLFGFLLLLASNAGFAQDLNAGLSYLTQAQNQSGVWGATGLLQSRDTAEVLETLRLLGQTGTAYSRGITGQRNLFADQNDTLARQIQALAVTGQNVAGLIDELLNAQGSEITAITSPNFPGRGWGIAPGFDSDTLDTSLALSALYSAGIREGLSIVGETVPVGATSTAKPFTLPSGVQDVFLFVRETSGAIRVNLSLPGGGTQFVDLVPGNVPVNVGPLQNQAGDWSVSVVNQDSVPAAFSLEIRYSTSGGLDASRLSVALSYLGFSQNPDGGWGIAPGEDSHLATTVEVLLALQTWRARFGPQSVLDRGVDWLMLRQNPDDGFSDLPNASTVYETALSALAIQLIRPNAPEIAAATGYLAAQQLPDGSWNTVPYDTAVAMRALAAARVLPAPQITSNGGAGVGSDYVTDQNIVTIEGIASLGTAQIRIDQPNASIVFDSVTGRFSIIVNLSEGANIFTITAIDGFGQAGNSTLQTITRDSTLLGQDLSIRPGLNLIGLNLDPVNPISAGGLINLFGPEVQKIQRIDPVTGQVESIARDASGGLVGSDFNLFGLDSLMITADDAVTTRISGRLVQPPVVDLVKGVNGLTVPNPAVNLDAFGLLQAIGDETIVGSLQRYDPAQGVFESAGYQGTTPSGTNFPILATESYLVHMLQDQLNFALPTIAALNLAITSPADGATVMSSPVAVMGTVAGGAPPIDVTVNNVPVPVSAGQFTARVSLNSGPNTITAEAMDQSGQVSTRSITVNLQAADYVITAGGSVSDSGIFTGDSSVLDQAVAFTENRIGIPPGFTYTTTGVSRISATEIQVSFQIDIAPGTASGFYQFQIEYGLLDSNSMALGPLTGNVFDFLVEVTP